ncbi:MAG: hypothetical protein UX78_C0002G0045 [Candidatus Amesbacteria bacterium GW2011_GWA2_47_11]|nr:MAG: hypothetical protein UX78_C0002G0045 [Candidatus Amesbacteria bacterium GW2011_GWA2_47_11]KKW00823.1 MAG: hypothetical protein UY33_C0004G0009 [Candidatus Amesbacteria bacterium GW2011_GWA1_48_9]OGD01632.1 MAG: hypothetical protein A2354_04425 [Candidatus Amesbacteria bacterium RIFOXYB1_FULL_47_12]
MATEKKLNTQQLEAVRHGTGPLLIIAGAGTGKTTVITERVKHLISAGLAQPEEILALTFTEKAAREMEERIDQALPYGYTQMWVMTFHSFCDRVLRDEGLHIGLSPDYKLLTETSATSLLRSRLFDLELDYFRPLGNPTKFIAGLLTHFSRLQDEDLSPEEYQKWVRSQKPKSDTHKLEIAKSLELARLYRSYTDIKAKENVLDFADLIAYALRLFRSRPNILKNYQDKFKYILVDEFQDTNYAQNQLVNLLAGRHRNLTVVADDDQAIYRWRGAAVSNVIQFKSIYPDAKLITLTQNYRSNQEILDRAYDLIQHNNPDRLEVKEKIVKKLVAVRKDRGEKIEFIHSDRVENEAEAVAKKINELLTPSSKLTYKDIAILVRANAHSEPFTRALSRHGIPSQFLGPARLFHQPEVKDLIAYLRVLYNFEDDPSFYRVLAMDFFALSPRDLASISNFSQRANLHLFEACEHLSGLSPTPVNIPLPLVASDTKDTLKQLVGIVQRHLALVPKETAGQILFYFLKSTGLLAAILKYQTPIDAQKAENITRFFNRLKAFETEHSDASVSAVVDWLDLSAEIGESPQAANMDWTENDAVNLLTIHSAKGLEFPAVFLVNLVTQRFPSTQRREQIPVPDELIKEILPSGDFHLQEERRLFYVGMTRARDRLFFTGADYYGEGKRTKKLSPFISEALGPELAEREPKIVNQLSLLDWDKPSFSVHKTAAANHKPQTINYLSFTQIQTFLDCPLHYKAKYLLKLPSPPSAASSFGNTVHRTLRDFYAQVKSGQSPDIQAIFLRNFSLEGYLNPKHAAAYQAKGLRFLQEYLDTQFDPQHLPEKLEEPFTIPLEHLKIGGKIDRVDLLPNGQIEIIDYKTSVKSLTPKEAQTDLQLSFYALAATSIPHFPFGKKPQEVILSLFYFEERKKVSVVRTPAQLEQAKQQIFSYASDISHSDFLCSGSTICQKCDFKILCDLVGTATST